MGYGNESGMELMVRRPEEEEEQQMPREDAPPSLGARIVELAANTPSRIQLPARQEPEVAPPDLMRLVDVQRQQQMLSSMMPGAGGKPPVPEAANALGAGRDRNERNDVQLDGGLGLLAPKTETEMNSATGLLYPMRVVDVQRQRRMLDAKPQGPMGELTGVPLLDGLSPALGGSAGEQNGQGPAGIGAPAQRSSFAATAPAASGENQHVKAAQSKAGPVTQANKPTQRATPAASNQTQTKRQGYAAKGGQEPKLRRRGKPAPDREGQKALPVDLPEPPALTDDQYQQAVTMVPGGGKQSASQQSNNKPGAQANGKQKNADNIQRYWPAILRAMHAEGVDDDDMVAYTLATLRAENDDFTAKEEPANSSNTTAVALKEKRFFDRYESKRKDLGNTEVGDGAKYRGRGFGQLTGRAEYADMQAETGWPLLEHPELAADPRYAARIFAIQMRWLAETKDFREQIKTGPGNNAEAAFDLYQRYLRDPNARGTTRDALSHNSLVVARKAHNGPAAVLPNGLENYLTAYLFGERRSNIQIGAKDKNFTVGQAAGIWTRGDAAGQAAFLKSLAAIGIGADTRYSELTAQQRAALEVAQAKYAGDVRKQIGRMSNEKKAIGRAHEKQREIEQKAKDEADKAGKQAEEARKKANSPSASAATGTQPTAVAGSSANRPSSQPQARTGNRQNQGSGSNRQQGNSPPQVRPQR
ncbi:MAG: hypothetical protein LAP21_09510 [Acidobacteriia bacterium]|nr:hypothetical protein [Terriglobia bacterium]